MSRKMENAVRLLEMILGAVEKNAPINNEEFRRTLEETRRFIAAIRKNDKLVEKWLKRDPQWRTLTLYFRNHSDEQDEPDEEEFVL